MVGQGPLSSGQCLLGHLLASERHVGGLEKVGAGAGLFGPFASCFGGGGDGAGPVSGRVNRLEKRLSRPSLLEPDGRELGLVGSGDDVAQEPFGLLDSPGQKFMGLGFGFRLWRRCRPVLEKRGLGLSRVGQTMAARARSLDHGEPPEFAKGVIGGLEVFSLLVQPSEEPVRGLGYLGDGPGVSASAPEERPHQGLGQIHIREHRTGGPFTRLARMCISLPLGGGSKGGAGTVLAKGSSTGPPGLFG